MNLALYDVPQLPNLVCPGSVCHYSPFESMGATADCQDVTIRAQTDCTREICQNPADNCQCQFTTPGGFKLYAETNPPRHGGFKYTRVDTSLSIGFYPQKFSRDRLFELGVIRFTPQNPGWYNWDSWRKGMQIYECTYTLAAVEYTNWSVANGTVSMGLMKTYPLTFREADRQTLLEEYTVMDPAFPYNSTFIINYMDRLNIRKILEAAFAPAPASTNSFLPKDTLNHSSDIQETMNNISIAMSWRMLSRPNSTVTRVPVLDRQVFITVRWAWISLPAALVFAMWLFLLVTIYQTYHAEHLIWKSSSTPLLLSRKSYVMPEPGRNRAGHGRTCGGGGGGGRKWSRATLPTEGLLFLLYVDGSSPAQWVSLESDLQWRMLHWSINVL